MDLVGKKVKHKMFKTGTVTAFDGKTLTVQFPTKESKFPYPDAFAKFIVAEEDVIQDMIIKGIEDAKREKEEAKRLEEEKRIEEERKRLEDLAKKTERVKPSVKKSMKKRVDREEGKRMTFFVFQGSTFNAEYKGGYIWAPKYNAGGNTCHHWDRLLEVREGDIILHGANGYIEAISVAKGPCYDAESPVELKEEELWANDGRMVDCKYTKIDRPIKTANFRKTIVEYCGVKYAPFDKDGNGNMGYLFEINPDLVRFFLEETLKKNGYLIELDYVQEVLAG